MLYLYIYQNITYPRILGWRQWQWISPRSQDAWTTWFHSPHRICFAGSSRWAKANQTLNVSSLAHISTPISGVSFGCLKILGSLVVTMVVSILVVMVIPSIINLPVKGVSSNPSINQPTNDENWGYPHDFGGTSSPVSWIGKGFVKLGPRVVEARPS